MTNKHCILVIFIAIILIFYAGPAGPIGLSFTERTNHLKPYHKAGKALSFCGQKNWRKKGMSVAVAEKVVCVTGGAGYIASWLVKLLLLRGYTVKATLRNPGHYHS